MEPAEPVHDSLSKVLVAAHHEMEKLEEGPWIEKHHSAHVDRGLGTFQLELEEMKQTNVTHLRLENGILLRQANNLSLWKSGFQSKLIVFELNIQWLTTNQMHVTLAPNTSELTPA